MIEEKGNDVQSEIDIRLQNIEFIDEYLVNLEQDDQEAWDISQSKSSFGFK